MNKMQTPAPVQAQWNRELTAAQADVNAADVTDIGRTMWQTVLDLIYRGHSDLAWKFVDELGPNAQQAPLPELSAFCALLKGSPYWLNIEPTLKDTPPACATGVPQGGLSNPAQTTVTPPPPRPFTPPPSPRPQRISADIAQGSLIKPAVQPVYPTSAKQAHVSGSVIFQATISKEGTIERLSVLSGHPLLVPAAIEAVKQWRYKPTLMDSKSVEVVTTITVNFPP